MNVKNTSSQLQVRSLSVQLGGQAILKGIDFSLEAGEIGCLLGPSGCGKTTLLRTIAGFEAPSAGNIQLGDHNVSDKQRQVPVEKRKVGMVFQDFALFPHLSVAQNIRFGLKGWPRQQAQQRVDELLSLIGLASHAEHRPHELSGGQQQRVAVARALAPKPDILLLDEPFSSMDKTLREQLTDSVRQIIKGEGVTALMVTHDQHEAFAMADRVGVMKAGELHQWDTPYRLYHQPDSRFVAHFVGRGTFIHGELNASGQLDTAIGELPVASLPSTHNGVFDVLIRPDDIIHDDQSPWCAKVRSRHFQGAHFLYTLELDSDESVLCFAPSHHNHMIGECIGIRHDAKHVVVFSR
ncbi:ferric cations import ATP-binding protein FbpC 2 [gamma proteobacterium HTCC5015]|nr:ferric cations import ATP-binding protein FbpC 2 [gamma proteobacterium HTCC5015]